MPAISSEVLIVIWILTLLVIADLVLTVFVFRKVCCKSAAERLDEVVERESARRSREMDEGFDNLMRYSVRGMDGFGGGE